MANMALIQYCGLFMAAAAFEFAYVCWARAAAAGRVLPTVAYSITTAGLSLAGLGGALSMQHGWVFYLAGIGAGAYVSAHLGRTRADTGAPTPNTGL